MEFLAGLFLAIAAWPILTGAVLIAFLVLALFFEKEGWATSIVLLFGGGLLYFTWSELSLMSVLFYAGVYIIIGMLYTVPQYISFSKKRSRRWKTFQETWVPADYLRHDFWILDKAMRKGLLPENLSGLKARTEAFNALSSDLKNEIETAWIEECDSAREKDWNQHHSAGFLKVRLSGEVTPKWEVYHDKPGLITQMLLWMVYWPAYLILLVVDDLLTHLVEWMVEKLGGWFTRISNEHFNVA